MQHSPIYVNLSPNLDIKSLTPGVRKPHLETRSDFAGGPLNAPSF